MAHASEPALLALHGVRVLGGPSAAAIAERFDLPVEVVREHLLDAQAYGWVTRHDYFGETWSLTEDGRLENERQLAAELEATQTRGLVSDIHARFVPLNRRHGRACTNWQLRPEPWDPLAANDHTDPIWDDSVLVELESLDLALRELDTVLSRVLDRFAGHASRHSAALHKARNGDASFVDAPDRLSCQLVWIQLHEDLLATLQIPRGSDA